MYCVLAETLKSWIRILKKMDGGLEGQDDGAHLFLSVNGDLSNTTVYACDGHNAFASHAGYVTDNNPVTEVYDYNIFRLEFAVNEAKLNKSKFAYLPLEERVCSNPESRSIVDGCTNKFFSRETMESLIVTPALVFSLSTKFVAAVIGDGRNWVFAQPKDGSPMAIYDAAERPIYMMKPEHDFVGVTMPFRYSPSEAVDVVIKCANDFIEKGEQRND